MNVERSALTMPRIHMNGTDAEGLIKQQLEVLAATDQLLAALRAASPHGRDYYPLGDTALRQARAEHDTRLKAVRMIADEANAIADAIQAQEGGR